MSKGVKLTLYRKWGVPAVFRFSKLVTISKMSIFRIPFFKVAKELTGHQTSKFCKFPLYVSNMNWIRQSKSISKIGRAVVLIKSTECFILNQKWSDFLVTFFFMNDGVLKEKWNRVIWRSARVNCILLQQVILICLFFFFFFIHEDMN